MVDKELPDIYTGLEGACISYSSLHEYITDSEPAEEHNTDESVYLA